jgi:hypothetical protein
MPREGAIIFRDLVGKVLNVECDMREVASVSPSLADRAALVLRPGPSRTDV